MKKEKLQTIPESEKLKRKLQEVSKKLKNAKRHLKSKKTQLDNLESGISQTMRADIPNFVDSLKDLEDKKDIIKNLKPKVKKVRGAKRKEKREMMTIIDTFMESSFLPPEMKEMFGGDLAEESNKFNLEDQESKSSDIFQDFIVEPSKTEQYDIRKIYVSLADKFHPDKAKNKKEEEDFHHIMQKINIAYKKFDYDTLYQMKIDYEKTSKMKEQKSNNPQEEEIETIENEIKYLKSQSKRIQGQINKTKNSGIGSSYEAFKDMFNSEEFDNMKMVFSGINTILTGLIELINEFIETKKINEEKLMEIDQIAKGVDDEIGDDFFDDEGEDFFDDDDDFDDEMMEMFSNMMMGGAKKKKGKNKTGMSKFEEEMIKEMLFNEYQKEMGGFPTSKTKSNRRKKKK